MRTGDIGRQDAQYRRGLVLGLTVAEAMLLVLFALLLALAALLVRRDTAIARLTARLTEVVHELTVSDARADVLQSMVERKPSDLFVKELASARERQKVMDQRQKALEAREKELEKQSELAEAVKGAGDKAQKVRELAALGARLENELKKVSPEAAKSDPFDAIPAAVAAVDAATQAGYAPEDRKTAFQRAEKAARETATLKGQVTRLRNDLAKVGRGGDYPPCWVTEAGKVEFLFDIELMGHSALRVRDATPPARLVDRRELAIPAALTTGETSPQRFLQLTRPLYDYSKAHECRFFVTVVDRTGPAQKDLFKRLLLTVEGRFYKVLQR